jgi:hypothetical protein
MDVHTATPIYLHPLKEPTDLVATSSPRNSAMGRGAQVEQVNKEITTPECVSPTSEVSIAEPERCKHGMNEAWCAICKKQSIGDCVDARGTSRPYKQSKKKRTKDKPWCGFSCCMECGESFLDKETQQPTILEFAFCNEKDVKQGKCKRAWLAEHKPYCELLKSEPRFQQVTPEDVDWAERQSAFPHRRPMSAKKLAEFFENDKRQREKQYEHDRALQALAHSLGDEWAATHPEMEATKKANRLCGGKSSDHSAGDQQRSNQIQDAQRKRVSPTKTTCLHCDTTFEARKGTKYCLKGSCRQRHHEEVNAAKDTRS